MHININTCNTARERERLKSPEFLPFFNRGKKTQSGRVTGISTPLAHARYSLFFPGKKKKVKFSRALTIHHLDLHASRLVHTLDWVSVLSHSAGMLLVCALMCAVAAHGAV